MTLPVACVSLSSLLVLGALVQKPPPAPEPRLEPRVPSATPWQDVEVTVHPVRGTVSMLEGMGGNVGVCAGEDGVLLVDDQFASMVAPIEEAVAELTDAPLRFVVNTHFHGDHTGGNELLSEKATILAHENVRIRLASAQTVLGRPDEARPRAAWPVVTYRDRVTLHLNNERIEVIHYANAHTDGDSIVYFRSSGVVHLGDLFTSGRFPFVDLDNGGSVVNLERCVSDVLAWLPAETAVIPGHGDLATKEELREFRDMLRRAIELVQTGLDGGASVKDLRERAVLAELDERWGGGFVDADGFIATIGAELTRED